MRIPRVLVSGFEPFAGGASNPSAMIVEALRDRGSREIPSDLRTLILPVTFSESFVRLEKELRDFKPDFVLALGQAGGRSRIELERIAINLIDAEIADNEGVTIREKPITLGGPNALFSSLPLRQLEEALRARQVPVRISNTAGLYVCNFVFYKLMEFMKNETEMRGGFVHLPYLPEQARDAEARGARQTASAGGETPSGERIPFQSFEVMLNGIQTVIESLAESFSTKA